MIQETRKKVDNSFNDFVAQLYQKEIKSSQEAKEEHIRQAKDKALEDEQKEKEAERTRQAEVERVAKENRKRDEMEAEQLRQENARNDLQSEQTDVQTTNVTQQASSSAIGNDWSQVSPDEASQYMSARTGVPASKWLDVIYKESSGNPYVENSITCYGFLQINQSVHGQVSNLSPQAYLDKAVNIYQTSGGTAWDTW